jgi:hypothetical protein
MAKVKFPSLSLIPLMFFAQDTIRCSVVVIIYAETVAWRIAGGVCAGLWLMFVIGVAMFLKNGFTAFLSVPESLIKEAARLKKLQERLRTSSKSRSGSIGGDESLDDSDDGDDGREKNCVEVFFFGDREWEDFDLLDATNEGFVRRFDAFFSPYRSQRYWFILVEFMAIFAMALATAFTPEDGKCGAVSIAAAIILVTYALVLTALLPYLTMYDTVSSTPIAIVQAIAALFLLLPEVTSGVDYLADYAAILVVASMYAAGGKTVIDLMLLLYETIQDVFCGGGDQKRRKQARKRSRQSSSQLDDEALLDPSGAILSPSVQQRRRGGHRRNARMEDDDTPTSQASQVLVLPRSERHRDDNNPLDRHYRGAFADASYRRNGSPPRTAAIDPRSPLDRYLPGGVSSASDSDQDGGPAAVSRSRTAAIGRYRGVREDESQHHPRRDEPSSAWHRRGSSGTGRKSTRREREERYRSRQPSRTAWDDDDDDL